MDNAHLHHRYSTHLYMHDDLVTLKTSLVVLDPGRFQLVHGLAVAGGLTGSYYDNTGQRGELPMSRTDAQVDFDWDLGAIGGLSVADFAGVRSPWRLSCTGKPDAAHRESRYNCRIEMCSKGSLPVNCHCRRICRI